MRRRRVYNSVRDHVRSFSKWRTRTGSSNISQSTANSKTVQRAILQLPCHDKSDEEEEEIYLPLTITILNEKNTILKLARSRLPEKQKAIYAGRQSMLAAKSMYRVAQKK